MVIVLLSSELFPLLLRYQIYVGLVAYVYTNNSCYKKCTCEGIIALVQSNIRCFLVLHLKK